MYYCMQLVIYKGMNVCRVFALIPQDHRWKVDCIIIYDINKVNVIGIFIIRGFIVWFCTNNTLCLKVCF